MIPVETADSTIVAEVGAAEGNPSERRRQKAIGLPFG
jgi:hypothetical protein